LTETNGGVWRFQVPNARGFAFDVTDRLVATEGAVAGIPIRVYHLPEHQVAASDVLRAVAEAIPLFMAAYGPYPYTGLTIVEAVQFGGMEYSGLITFSSQAFTDYKPPDPDAEFGAHFLIKFVVHEIGHQWWYGAVGNDQAHEPWLDEALARYGEWLYYSQLHPRDLAWWEAPSAGMATLPINQPIYNFTDTSGYVQAIYVSGARFLLALREQMGDEAFSAFLREYYAQNRDRIVSQSEFLSLLRAYAGPDVEGLLAVYFSPPP
jgi:aminopeptidase N